MAIETTYSQAREQLKALMDRAVDDREVIVVHRRSGDAVAMIAADELESLLETAHLLRSSRNAERLLAALNRARSRDLKPTTPVLRHETARLAVCHPEFLEDLRYWVETDRRTTKRLLELVEAVLRDPFDGIGKPEPLKYLGPDIWSRRITQEHRCVYLVKADRVEFLQGRYHY